MANQEHLDVLRQGAEAWNHWKNLHPYIHPNFAWAALNRAILTGVDFSWADLSRASFFKTTLSRSNFIGATLAKANLIEAILTEASLMDTDLTEAILIGATLTGADLSGANLSGATFVGANLSRSNVSGANLYGANLSRANLTRADLSGADLTEADLTEVTLPRTDLSGATSTGTDLTEDPVEANLARTKFAEANLTDTILIRANLTGSDLDSTILVRTDLTNTDLSRTQVIGTMFVNIDLSVAKGLDSLRHRGPSSIGIDTIYRSHGDIPEIFLRGTGIPDAMIEYMRSLVGKPIEYYTCFISYSSKDEPFAKRLYADLQQNGVRCWFAPEDMKIGDKIRHRIDESIRLYDKLLLVLSQHSLASTWVEKEVETAFDKEAQSNKLVLFPVRLDDTVMQTNQAWAADIRRMRHIGDFTRWKNHDDYQQAFERLMRDLKAGE